MGLNQALNPTVPSFLHEPQKVFRIKALLCFNGFGSTSSPNLGP